MEYDFQRASLLRRAPAWLFDVILLIVLATGVIAGLAYLLDWDTHLNNMDAVYVRYEEEYQISFSDMEAEMAELDEAGKTAYMERLEKANEALSNDAQAQKAYNMVMNVFLVMMSVGLLIPHLILEFLVPLLLKNGQTLGKKIFGVALVRKDGIRVTTFMMFARTILGKYTIETMLPMLLLVGSIFSILGIVGPAVVLIFLLIQVIMTVVTKNKTAIHDALACTVAVDLSSQMIFDSVEEMDAYHEEIRKSAAGDAEY